MKVPACAMIEKYTFGSIVVDGVEYFKDLIIFPEKIKSNWWRIEGHRLRVEDLKDVFAYNPDILVIGKGAYGFMKVSNDVKKALSERGALLKEGKTAEACDMYNELIKKGKNTVAALHLTAENPCALLIQHRWRTFFPNRI